MLSIKIKKRLSIKCYTKNIRSKFNVGVLEILAKTICYYLTYIKYKFSYECILN